VSLNPAPPFATVPAEPRVSLNPAPPMATVPGAPGLNELTTVNPRVRWSDPISTLITEPLSSPLTTNVPVTHPTIDLSYSTYNHNGPQRRRQQRHNRRDRNPINLPTVSHSPSVPTITAESHLILPTTTTTPPPVTTPIPTLASDPVSTDPVMAALNHSQPVNATRRSTRGKKIVRFDPRTHRLLSTPTYHANSLTSVPSSADTFLNESSEIRLRQALQGPAASIWERAVTMELARLAQGIPGLVEGTNTMRFIPHSHKPSDRISSYCRTVCSINTNKPIEFDSPTVAIAQITITKCRRPQLISQLSSSTSTPSYLHLEQNI